MIFMAIAHPRSLSLTPEELSLQLLGRASPSLIAPELRRKNLIPRD